jgi:Mn-dependent DtxR family transcriptional regulator
MLKQCCESSEDYLEALLLLQQNQSDIHAIDLVNFTGYTKPSISRAIHKLVNQQYLIVDENNHLQFTPEGYELAQKIYYKHTTLTKFFISLGVDPEIAEVDACRIEHIISETTFQAICDSLALADQTPF